MTNIAKNVVVLGGGIAGTSCAESILGHTKLHDSSVKLTLISASAHVVVGRALARSARAQEVSVHCLNGKEWAESVGCSFMLGEAVGLDPKSRRLRLRCGSDISYEMICLATGASPRIPSALGSLKAHVHVLRDVDSFYRLQNALQGAEHVLVVGNGGVALEVVHALENVNITWVHRNAHEGAAFFDDRSINALRAVNQVSHSNKSERESSALAAAVASNIAGGQDSVSSEAAIGGAAHGPYWNAVGSFRGLVKTGATLTQIGEAEIIRASRTDSSQVRTVLTTGQEFNVDLIVCGTGVRPRIDWLTGSGLKTRVGPCGDMGIAVKAGKLESSVSSVFAAGDCTTVFSAGDEAMGTDWLQKFTWTQARSAGIAAGREISSRLGGTEEVCGMEFELFAHATRFLGVPVVFLGRYAAQELPNGYQMIESSYSSAGFARVVLVNGRLRGALLIGEAVERSETFENLILDALVLSDTDATSLVDFSFDVADFYD